MSYPGFFETLEARPRVAARPRGWHEPASYLVGFMGAGKSTLARALGRRLDWRVEDIDELIEARERRSVSEIFATHGEPYFRLAEREVLRRGRRARSRRRGHRQRHLRRHRQPRRHQRRRRRHLARPAVDDDGRARARRRSAPARPGPRAIRSTVPAHAGWPTSRRTFDSTRLRPSTNWWNGPSTGWGTEKPVGYRLSAIGPESHFAAALSRGDPVAHAGFDVAQPGPSSVEGLKHARYPITAGVAAQAPLRESS